MIRASNSGSFKNTTSFLERMQKGKQFEDLHTYAREGLAALSHATPRDTGRAAGAWSYEISQTKDRTRISWTNTDVEGGANVIILLQYGHGTGTGGYVQGRDFINPTMRPIFDKIADNVWKHVTSA